MLDSGFPVEILSGVAGLDVHEAAQIAILSYPPSINAQATLGKALFF